jgi:hypothetical protein
MRTLGLNLGKGLLLGAANVAAVAWGVGAINAAFQSHASFEASDTIFQLGIVPGLLTGAVCGAVAHRARAARELLVTSIALTAVLLLGLALAPEFIPFATVTTVPLALLLCRWTRPPADPLDIGPRLGNAAKGAILGGATVFAAAAIIGTIVMLMPPEHRPSGDGEELTWNIGFPVHGRDPGSQIGMLILVIGMLPGLVTGLGVGALADSMDAWRRSRRLLVLGTLAVTAVATLGTMTQMRTLIPVGCLPALLAVAVLERWTLRPKPALPDARVVRATLFA